MKKIVLIHSKEQLVHLLDANIKDFIFGLDQFTAIGVGKINQTVFDEMIELCQTNNASVYALANIPIHEFELDAFKAFLMHYDTCEVIKSYLVSDYSALQFKREGFFCKDLIYSPDTLVTNSADKQTFYDLGYSGTWIAPELSIDETANLLGNDTKDLVQVFGYIKTSNSKRQLLTNYAHQLNQDLPIHNNDQLTLIEETRKQKMPIIENDNGTTIFTDFVLYDPKRLAQLKQCLGMVYSALFIDIEDVIAAVNDHELIHKDNYILDSYYWESESTIRKEVNEK